MFVRSFPTKDEYAAQAKTHNVIPVCTEILADMDTPVSMLRRFFLPGRDCFLLESMEGGEKWNRYSFLGVNCKSKITVYRDRVDIREGGKVESIQHNGDPLAVMRDIMARYTPAELDALPRFFGGMVGYFTYETVSFFEHRVKSKLKDDEPYAEFVIPDELIIFDNVRHTLMCVVLTFIENGENAGKLFERAHEKLEKMLEVVRRPFGTMEADRQEPLTLKAVREDEYYRDIVRKTKQMIYDGEIVQAVPSQVFTCKAPADPTALYRALRFINPSPYLYFMHISGKTICGASPETMVRLNGRTACVRPIAGTRRRGATEREDSALATELHNDPKERAEHLMLVDLGRNDLGKVAKTGTVKVTDLMFIERYSHVMHLVSNVECQLLDDVDAFDLFKATFPAGTLSGAPKVRAMEIIAEFEDSPRGPYGGAVGYLAFGGNMDFAITIRTAVIEDGVLRVRAGGGIVADSDPEAERMETVNKAKSVERALLFIGDRM